VKLACQIITVLLLLVSQVSFAGNNISKKEFLNLVYKDSLSQVEAKTLWLDQEIQEKIIKILDHKYPKLRLRYKQLVTLDKNQTVWFLDEIGKERPISFAVSITNNQIDLIRVTKFRESRGGEIQMLAFSEQFNQIGLNEENQLNKNIDGITGATMSVSAMKKISRIALTLHKFVSSEVSAQ